MMPGIHTKKAKIAFMADPNRPETVKGPAGSNFMWVRYQMLFATDEQLPRYFYYDVELDADGSKKPPALIFQSDQEFNSPKKVKGAIPGPVTFDAESVEPVGASESTAIAAAIEKESQLIGALDLSPYDKVITVYVNLKEGSGRTYTAAEFVAKYVKSGLYMISSGKGSEGGATALVDPFGGEVKNPVGISYPRDEEMKAEKTMRMAVRIAMENGFGVMRGLVREQKQQQGLAAPASGSAAYTSGFSEVQEQYPERKPEQAAPGYNIVEKAHDSPVPVKK